MKVHGSGRGERRILDGVDLDVGAGELVAIVGRSGSGKSTLLQILGGLDRADAGTVAVAGRSVAGSPAPSERQLSALRREEIGFVFQFFHLLAELDGEANVLLPTTLPGADRGGAARGRALIAQLGLSDVAGLRPHQLSGGEQQRFALARALVGNPSLVLADEPIGNLDAAAGEVVLDLLRGVADAGSRGRHGHPPGRGDRARRPRPAAGGRRARRGRARQVAGGATTAQAAAPPDELRAAHGMGLAARPAGARGADRGRDRRGGARARRRADGRLRAVDRL